jgi:hypothetical protein
MVTVPSQAWVTLRKRIDHRDPTTRESNGTRRKSVANQVLTRIG